MNENCKTENISFRFKDTILSHVKSENRLVAHALKSFLKKQTRLLL